MAEISLGADTKQSLNASFFFWMALGMAAIVFGGFGITYLQPLATGSLGPIPPIVHIHGFFYFTWLILLVVQPFLIRRGSVALHRNLGLFGISIGTGVVIFGCIVTVIFTKRAVANSNAAVYGLMYISLLAVLGFGGLLFLAIKNIRNSASHKRYILLATAVLIIGGLNRIYGALGFGLDGDFGYLLRYLTVDLFVFALLVHDWKTMGKPHTSTLIGGSVNIIPQLLHAPIVGSSSFTELTHWLGNLAS